MKTKAPKQFKFKFEGVEFILPGKFYHTTGWNGQPVSPYIHVNRVAAAKLIKQYVKVKYPDVVCTVSSDSYSGGSSTDAYLSDKYGFPVDEKIYKDVYRFGKFFQEGSFNGMIDMYEYGNKSFPTENGTKIAPSVKYVFVRNSAKFDSVQDICNSIIETMKGGKYSGQENRPHSIEESVEILRNYHNDEGRIERAVKLVEEYLG